MTDDYPPIADHGLIGDQQTCALVDTGGTINWFCCPRFDSPSVFASLLDHTKGGHFRLAPAASDVVTKQLYFPDTAILITRFMSSEGVGEICDFMPIDRPWIATDRHTIVRMLRVPRGTMTFDFEVAPRFDYGRAPHKLQTTEHGAVFESDHGALTLHSPVALEQRGDDVGGSITLNAGDVTGFILESGTSDSPRRPAPDALDAQFRDTARFWRQWLARLDVSTAAGATWCTEPRSPSSCSHTRRPAHRSRPRPQACPSKSAGNATGTTDTHGSATVRSPSRPSTGSGSLTTRSMFLLWLRDRFENRAADASGPLRIMYRVDGSADLEESTLDHWEGYRGSAPVRIGNGATDQLQLDIYGEALRRALSRRAQAAVDRQARLERPAQRSSIGCARTGTSPKKGSGRRAAAVKRSCTAG